MNNPKYILSNIRTAEFFTRSPQTEIDENKLSYQVNYSFAYDENKKLIAVSVGYTMFSNNQNQTSDDLFLSINIELYFLVSNYEEIVDKDSNIAPENRIDLSFARTLLSISFSTLRGSLHSKTEGSSYGRFFLPILDIADILPE